MLSLKKQSLLFFIIFIMRCRCDLNENAFLRFYLSRQNHFIELPLDKSTDIFLTSWYKPNKDTVIFAHGFTGNPNGLAVKTIVQTYLDNGDNVALLNWEKLAAVGPQGMSSSYVGWAAPNSRKLGIKFAAVLEKLQTRGLNLDTTHLIGHSLGAQLFGIAGNNLMAKGIQLPWITGLDPASLGFENKANDVKIHSKSAILVEIVHSDPHKYGYKKSAGTVDFWPNYKASTPMIQPGCPQGSFSMFSSEDLCNHRRSWQFYADAVKNKNIFGSYAKNYRTWKQYSNEERRATVLPLACIVADLKPGDYFFTTKENSPYGLGLDGLEQAKGK